MELIERYVKAVTFWLPRTRRPDIAAELTENLRSRIEGDEARLGRRLAESEVVAVLQECGRPFVVASRYLPQQHLVGPVLFPVYRFLLAGVFWLYLVPWLVVWIGMLAFVPSYRERHLGPAALDDLGTWASIAVWAFGLLTLLFAAIERGRNLAARGAGWDPRQLPGVRARA